MIEFDMYDEWYTTLLRYVDGELPEVQHQQMFAELAVNPLLQRDLTMMLTMRAALLSDVPPPPPTLEEGIVSTLFAPQIAAEQSAFVRTRDGVIWALLSSLITLLLMGYPSATSKQAVQDTQTKRRDDIGTLTDTHAEKIYATNGITTTDWKDIRVVKHNGFSNSMLISPIESPQKSLSELKQMASQPEQTIQHITHTDNPDELNTYTDEALAITPAIFSVSDSVLLQSNTPTTPQSLQQYTGIATNDIGSTHNLISVSPEQFKNDDAPMYRAEMRFFSMQSYPNVALPGLITPPINDFALTMTYAVSAEHSIGIEVGQENQLQRFTTYKEGRMVNIEQNYLAWWTGAVYEYTPQVELFDIAHPFLRGSIGITNIGPIGRTILGMEIPLIRRMSLMAGGEAMAGLSWHQGNTVSTMKLGFCTGLSIRF
jgi:hypothetical protein